MRRRRNTPARRYSAPSIAAQTTSDAATHPDKAIGPKRADREAYGSNGFTSPSGNIGCMIDLGRARCDISEQSWAPPPRPADCELEFGDSLTVSSGEPAVFTCHGDTAFGAQSVLQYGESIKAGVVQCESAETGVTCRDVQSGQGFSLSREAYRLF